MCADGRTKPPRAALTFLLLLPTFLHTRLEHPALHPAPRPFRSHAGAVAPCPVCRGARQHSRPHSAPMLHAMVKY